MDPSLCFQRPRIFGSWLMFSEDQWFFGLCHMFSEDQRFWILAHGLRGRGLSDFGSCFQRTNGFWGFGSCFQRAKGSGSWLIFSKAKDFGALAHIFKRPEVLDPGSCF